MPKDDTKPVITTDSITIPRFGGQRETLPLPPGSQTLVQQYLEFEQVEDGLDQAAAAIAAAKKIITNSRKQFAYELMGRATSYAKTALPSESLSRGEVPVEPKPQKSTKKATKDK